MVYNQIQQECRKLGIKRACSALGMSKTGYMWWLKTKPANSNSEEMKIRSEIQRIAVEFPYYGYRRITVELKEFGVNHKRVLRIMREDNLLCLRKKAFKPQTTDSNHDFRVYPNLTRGLEISDINQLWVADITYIRLQKEFVYLAVVVDVFSRRCIGWELSRGLDAEIALNALLMALSNRKGANLSNLIHHSDQGVQYACELYVHELKMCGIRISMSSKGNPYENAFAESFIKTLKYEEVYLSEYESFNEAHNNIRKFIEEVYNKKRIHSSIGYLPPIEFEREVSLKRKKGKIKVSVS